MFYIYMCRNDWMKRIKKQINVNFKIVQMIRKDVFEDSDRCLLAEAKDSERCRETDSAGSNNWFGQMRSVVWIQHYSAIALFEV